MLTPLLLYGCVLLLAGGCGGENDPVAPADSPPAACFTVTPPGGSTETLFELDASCSVDSGDASDSLLVRWDLEGDGEWDTEWTTVTTATHQYDEPGTRMIRLEVRHSDGSTTEATRSVAVADPAPEGFVLIPPGTFTMGSPPGEPGRYGNEAGHEVTLTGIFYMGIHEVTQAEWKSVMEEEGSPPPFHFTGDSLPVEGVTWFDCIYFCNRRSISEGLAPAYTITDIVRNGNRITSATVTWDHSANGYRLPTEAEWEYACRAGSTTAFANGPITHTLCSPVDPNLTQVGWYCGNSGSQTHDVGRKSSNAWGLYDMHGNVWEWCWDWHEYYQGSAPNPTGPASGSARVCRGGSWFNHAKTCRSAYRSCFAPGYSDNRLGLRLARTAS